MSVRHLTRWEEFRVWLELDRTQLGMDLATYYGICSVIGLIQGFCIGYTIVGCVTWFMGG